MTLQSKQLDIFSTFHTTAEYIVFYKKEEHTENAPAFVVRK
jgi:hypothetical protein